MGCDHDAEGNLFHFHIPFCFFFILLPVSAPAITEDPEQKMEVIEEILADTHLQFQIPDISKTSLTGGYEELCSDEEGNIIPTFTPENAANIGIDDELPG